MKKAFFLFLFFFLVLVFPGVVRAYSCEDYSSNLSVDALGEIIADCSAKIQNTQDKAKTLNQEITLMNNRIRLTSLKILQTEAQIKTSEQEIEALSGKIIRLDGSLNSLSKALLSRVGETYKQGKVNTFSLLLSSKNFSEFVTNYRYLQAVQVHDREMLLAMEETRTSYDEQKQLKEKLQAQLVKLKNQLNSDQVLLAKQKKEKENLLIETQNNEKVYAAVRDKALAEIASLKGFTEKQKGGILPPQESPDGWFYSQRDERWAMRTIGYSRETIFDVGCLVSDIAMVFTFYGDRKTPADIASNPTYFSSIPEAYAYMKRPWPSPSGKSPQEIYSLSAVDEELNGGRPVIVHLNLGGDGHFVVLKKKDGDDYIMHDPWNGYDKKFKDYYSVSAIDKRVVYK